jgi:hypothetical protein
MGAPATGTGYLSAVPGTGGAITLPTSAFGIDTTGFLPIYYPYLQSNTFAQFVNAEGQFFAGGGAAAGQGTVIHSGKGQRAGTWIIHEGKNGFGGAMGLLGRWGANYRFVIPGKPGTYVGYAPGAGVKAFGRVMYATPTQYTPMGKTTNWANPHVATIIATNNVNGNVASSLSRNSATIWTTGSARAYARAGGFPSIVFRGLRHRHVGWCAQHPTRLAAAIPLDQRRLLGSRRGRQHSQAADHPRAGSTPAARSRRRDPGAAVPGESPRLIAEDQRSR